MKLLQIASVFLLFFAVACSREPELIEPGQQKCAHCGMIIQDFRFQAQAMTDTGKRFHFDSTECMLQWTFKSPHNIQRRWVKNFSDEAEWLDASLVEESKYRTALFLHSDRLRSPMGGGMAAFGDGSQIGSAIEKFGGKQEDVRALDALLKSQWKGSAMPGN